MMIIWYNSIWNLSGLGDPSVLPGTGLTTQAPIGSIFADLTTGALYSKTGPGPTDWTLNTGSGSAGIAIEDDGIAIAGNPHTIINFVGAGVTATDIAGVATITIPDAGGNAQRFVYTATGAEGNSFVIPLPAARLNTSYVAQVTGGGMAFQLTFDTPVSGYTANQIHVNSSGALTAGDKLIVVVADLT